MPLPHQRVGPDDAARHALVLHGILGSKTNWRTLIRKVSATLPGWDFVLPDLRNHGDAQGLAPPHTLDTVVDDLGALASSLHLRVDAVIGHSYGGKAALTWAHRHRDTLEHVVVVDANPGARPLRRGAEGTLRAVEALAALPRVWAAREDFTAALRAQGFSDAMTSWLAMNLTPDAGAFRLRTDVDAIRAMLDDYFARDLWHVLEAPPARLHALVLVGGRSPALDDDDRARLARATEACPRVRAVTLAEADHWVHVDAPEATARLVVEALAG